MSLLGSSHNPIPSNISISTQKPLVIAAVFAVDAGAPNGHLSSSNCRRCVDCMPFFNKTIDSMRQGGTRVASEKQYEYPAITEISISQTMRRVCRHTISSLTFTII
jgi:hypothetical protein